MSIPWKSLYTDPVIIEVDGLHIIAGPESGTCVIIFDILQKCDYINLFVD